MTPPIPVLLYHSVSDSPVPAMSRFTVTPRRFGEHLDRLLAHGRTAMTFGALAGYLRRGEPLPPDAVAVTFDDGLADFAHHAWPQLKDRDLPATLYPVAGQLGGRSRWLPGSAGNLTMLKAGELCTLADEGVEIGAHSMSHPELDQVPLERAEHEIVESKDVLEQVIGRQVTTFAYPHGHHTRAIKEVVAGAGYTSAAAVRNMFTHDRDDVFAVARLTVTDRMSADDIDWFLRGRGARRAPGRELIRTKAGRGVRRFRLVSEPSR